MKRLLQVLLAAVFFIPTHAMAEVSFEGEDVYYNGGLLNKGGQAAGLLMSSRMIHAAVEEYNPKMHSRWAYPSGGWSAERNVSEFIDALPTYAGYGLNMVTVGMMGGHPRFKCSDDNAGAANFSMFQPDGTLKSDAENRLQRVITKADQVGIIVNVQFFYRTVDSRLNSNDAVDKAIREATTFLKDMNTGNILIEVVNEASDAKYDFSSLKIDQLDERIEDVKDIWPQALATVSLHSGKVYPSALKNAVDWASLHANALSANELPRYLGRFDSYNMPVAITEDAWDGGASLDKALDNGVGFGYYDQGCEVHGSYTGQARYVEGYQSLPVNWGVNTTRKRAFFEDVQRVT